MGKQFLNGLLHSVLAIYVAGLLLDEAGKGTFGSQVKSIAGRITNGYGQS